MVSGVPQTSVICTLFQRKARKISAFSAFIIMNAANGATTATARPSAPTGPRFSGSRCFGSIGGSIKNRTAEGRIVNFCLGLVVGFVLCWALTRWILNAQTKHR